MSRLIQTNRRPERCAVCHDKLGREPLLVCPACGSVVHTECRASGTRCPTFGCRGELGASFAGAAVELPAAPRRVRTSPNFWARCFLPLLIPHFWIGIGMFTAGAFSLGVVTLGSDVPARVLKADVQHHKKGGVSYSLQVAYPTEDGDRVETANVNEDLYVRTASPAEIAAGRASVTVRHLELGPFHGSGVVGSLWQSSGVQMLPFSLLWCSVMSVFAYMLIILPIRRWLLVKHGLVAAGTIVERKVGAKGAKSVKFKFCPAGVKESITAEVSVSNEQYEQAREGQVVTVLHHAQRPSFAIIYELCGHEVIAA